MTMESLATTTTSTFRMACRVAIRIAAAPDRIWSLLTDAADFPRWNSTVTSIGGTIALGEKLTLRVPTSERTFTPEVTDFVDARRMVWSDGMAPMFRGERTFTLTRREDGTTDFEMVEVFSGVMLPLIKRSLPDFSPIFERYARDLKNEAERNPS
jgi:hypothetical protein